MIANKHQKVRILENVPSVISVSPNSSYESDLDIATVNVKEKIKLRKVPSIEEEYVNGQLPEFCLFMMIGCVLTASLLLGASSAGSLVWRGINTYLTTADREEPVMFIAAVILLISSILGFLSAVIVCCAQNQPDSSSDLLLVLLFFSSLMFLLSGCGALLNLKLRTQWKFIPSADGKRTKHPIIGTHKKVILQDCKLGHALNKTLLRKIQEYDSSARSRKSWDSTQTSLECCGVNGPEDWFKYNTVIPKSCCKMISSQEDCDLHSAFKDGCLDILAFYLRWWLATLGGYGCLHLSLAVILLILVTCMFFKIQRNKSKEKRANPTSCPQSSVTLVS